MRALRLIPVLVAAPAAAVLAGPAHAAGTGCPVNFALAPVSVLGTDYEGQADNVNHDGWICIRILPSGIGVFMDNVTP